MKVLLINPNSHLIDKSWAYRKFFAPIAPLGLAYIASLLEKNKMEVLIADQFADKMPDDKLLDSIKKEKPQIIGFSALTPVVPDIKRLVSKIRKACKDSKIVLGNIHASCFPEELLKENIADIVIRGEGEITMLELCKSLIQNRSLEEVKGLSFIMDGSIIQNPDREIIEDLDSLPLPAWHLIKPQHYTRAPLIGITNAMALPIIASRGCPYRCYYCSQGKIFDRVRYRNLGSVVDEMEYFSSRFKVKYFGFCDSYFPADEESGLEFCDLVMKRGLHKKLKWCTETRVDKVSRPLLKAMKESGAHLIMYGVEVGNERILKSLNKGTTLEQAREALKETRKAGILSQGLFILGLPGEAIETCKETVKFAKELDCDFAKFNIALPYPGSRFFQDYNKLNKFVNFEKFTSWFDWTASNDDLVYAPEGIDTDTLRYLQRSAMVGFYFRPKFMLRHIAKITISYKNIFYGGVWLTLLFCSGVLKKLKKIILNNK